VLVTKTYNSSFRSGLAESWGWLINKGLVEVVLEALSGVTGSGSFFFFDSLSLSLAGFKAEFSGVPSCSVSGELSLGLSVFPALANDHAVHEVRGERDADSHEHGSKDRECIDPTHHKFTLDYQHFYFSLIEFALKVIYTLL